MTCIDMCTHIHGIQADHNYVAQDDLELMILLSPSSKSLC